MAQTHIVRQRDFSGGHLTADAKRRDDVEQVRAGGRQMRNWRPASTGNLTDRPGRRALFQQRGRTETVKLPGENTFRISFGNGTVAIRDASSTTVATHFGYAWTWSTLGQISFCVINRDVLMCFPGSIPKIARYETDGTWSFFDFGFKTGFQGEIRAPFYRFSDTADVSLYPTARSGIISIKFSAPVLDEQHVGSSFSYKGRQIRVDGFVSGTEATATVVEELPPAQVLEFPSAAGFYPGQIVKGSLSTASGEIIAVSQNGGPNATVTASSSAFVIGEIVDFSPSGAIGHAYDISTAYSAVYEAEVPVGTMLVRDTVTVASTSATGEVLTFVPGSPGTCTIDGKSGAMEIGDVAHGYVSNADANVVAITSTYGVATKIFIVSGSPSVGDTATGRSSGFSGPVSATGTTAYGRIIVQLDDVYSGFDATSSSADARDMVVSPTTRQRVRQNGTKWAGPQASIDWSEQAISDYRGWPSACMFDRSRVSFFDLPQLPEGILWSAVASYADFFVGPNAADAMFELVPGRKHVLYMAGGADQFVFTDEGIYFIPISASSPLKPGSVSFTEITPEGCGSIKPVPTADGIIFANPGRTRILSIVQTGYQTRPYMTQELTEFCSDIIISPICIAATTGNVDFTERYVYVVNSDGSLAVGRFSSSKKWVGWMPWDGVGAVQWASALGLEMLFTTKVSGDDEVYLVEIIDNDQDMDGVVTIASPPATLAPGVGQGPLWFYAGLSVDLMDNGRDLGSREVNADGNLVLLANDDFSSETIIAGLAWEAVFEPFVPHVQEGQDANQTQQRRRLSRAAVAVSHSVGFEWGDRTIPPYEWGEEGGEPPPLREGTYRFRNLGRSFDPRAVLRKVRPGSISIEEVSLEVTV